MINGKTILGIIPARGGSKGIPRKNLIIFGGKPLMAWTIEAGLQSHYIDRLILSSEDEEIIAVAREWGCEVPFIRPAELSRDDTPGIEPVIHAIKTLKTSYDYIILLQPTSPLRSAEDIDDCINYCIQAKAVSCVSVTVAQPSPYWMYTLDQQKKTATLVAHRILFSTAATSASGICSKWCHFFCSYPLLVARAAFYQRRDHCFSHAG
jgi:CMP-N,N'-diacetyllegionaminic acid synthase